MPTLYVDVDDTLIIWMDPLEGRISHEWKWNRSVIQFMRMWKGEIILWSSGGKEYASIWADRLFRAHEIAVDRVDAKWPVIPVEDDVFLDDSPFSIWASHSLHPRELADHTMEQVIGGRK